MSPERLSEIALQTASHLKRASAKADPAAITRYLARYRLTPAEREAVTRVVLDLLVEALTRDGRPPLTPVPEKH